MAKLFSTVLFLLASLLLFSLSGCAGGERTITVKTIDLKTGLPGETTTTVTSSFWESENQRMAYDFEQQRIAAHERVTLRQLEQIEANAARRALQNLSPAERAYADANDQITIANLRTSLPPSGIPLPKNAADVMERNVIPLAHVGAYVVGNAFGWDIGNPFGGTANGRGNTSLKHVNAGRDLYINATRKDAYSLAERSTWNGTDSNTPTWRYEDNDGNATTAEGDAQTTSDKTSSLF